MFFDFGERAREKKRERERAENRGSEGVMSHVYYANTPTHPTPDPPTPLFLNFFEGCTVYLLSRMGEVQVQFDRKRADGAPRSSSFLSFFSTSSLPASFHPQLVPPTVRRQLQGPFPLRSLQTELPMLVILYHPPAAVHI